MRCVRITKNRLYSKERKRKIIRYHKERASIAETAEKQKEN